jgi:hypothetical protein
MKSKTPVSLLALQGWLSGITPAAPFGTAFTYQGRLTDGPAPANGNYDLRFAVFDAANGPNQIGPTLTTAASAVINGLFTVTLDFGAGVFAGNTRWLDIAVRTNDGGAFTPLTPRQPLTPAPQALYATQAGSATTVASNSVTSAQIADGAIAFADLVQNAAADGQTIKWSAALVWTVVWAALIALGFASEIAPWIAKQIEVWRKSLGY